MLVEDGTTVPGRPSRKERKAARLQRRQDLWEARRNGPPPPRQIHRAIVLILFMALAVVMLYLLVFHSAPVSRSGN